MKRTRLERARSLTNAKLTAARGDDIQPMPNATVWKDGNITSSTDGQQQN